MLIRGPASTPGTIYLTIKRCSWRVISNGRANLNQSSAGFFTSAGWSIQKDVTFNHEKRSRAPNNPFLRESPARTCETLAGTAAMRLINERHRNRCNYSLVKKMTMPVSHSPSLRFMLMRDPTARVSFAWAMFQLLKFQMGHAPSLSVSNCSTYIARKTSKSTLFEIICFERRATRSVLDRRRRFVGSALAARVEVEGGSGRRTHARMVPILNSFRLWQQFYPLGLLHPDLLDDKTAVHNGKSWLGRRWLHPKRLLLTVKT